MSDPSSQPTQPLTEGPCQPVYVHTYGLDRETWEKLFDRVADAAHALDESVSCSGGNECALCVEQPTREELYAELSRLRAENTALREARDGECPRCRFPMWSHDLWKCIPWDMGEYVGDDELRREVVLRELNQGALAGMSSEVTVQAADLVLAALNRYDAWRAEPDPRALGLDHDGRDR